MKRHTPDVAGVHAATSIRVNIAVFFGNAAPTVPDIAFYYIRIKDVEIAAIIIVAFVVIADPCTSGAVGLDVVQVEATVHAGVGLGVARALIASVADSNVLVSDDVRVGGIVAADMSLVAWVAGVQVATRGSEVEGELCWRKSAATGVG